MQRRTVAALGLFSVLREELAKVPAFLSFKLQDSAKQHVESASKTFDFLKGNSPNDTPEVRAKRQKHKEMYDALMKEQQAQAAELRAKHKAKMAAMSWREKAQAMAKEAKEALQQMTAANVGVMALLQHCTASHAAEVAVEQGIDVKNVRMVLEKQQKPNSIEYEEVVVGYIDAPTASEEELFAFAEKLHKACPVANSMHIEWKRDRHEGQTPLEEQLRKEPAAGPINQPSSSPSPSATPETSSVDYATFAREGMSSFDSAREGGNGSTGAVPTGTPGSRRFGGGGSGLDRGILDEDDALHLPGVKRRQRGKAKGSSTAEGAMPDGMPGGHRLRPTGAVMADGDKATAGTADGEEKQAAANTGGHKRE